MAFKMKRICKGFKSISKIFVVKERELEIGCPTDVKHVAHIGFQGSSGSAPNWMNEFKTTADNSIRNTNPTSSSTRSAQDLEQPVGCQAATEMMRNRSCTDISNVTKKRKKNSTSIPRSASSKSARISKTKALYTQLDSEPVGCQSATEMKRNRSCTDISNVTKKQKRKKNSTSIPRSASSKSARISKTKALYTQLDSEPNVGI